MCHPAMPATASLAASAALLSIVPSVATPPLDRTIAINDARQSARLGG